MKPLHAALLLIAAPALADERPTTIPTRDVDVVYVATVAGKPVQQRTRTLAGAAGIRIDTPSPGLYMILNRSARTLDMVNDSEQGVVHMPYDPALVSPLNTAQYRRLGTDTVAGLACTDWLTNDTTNSVVAACFTNDGVMLRARAGTQVLVAAATVAYGRLDPAIFAIPPGYRQRDAPTKR